jgi:hypothetical protein
VRQFSNWFTEKGHGFSSFLILCAGSRGFPPVPRDGRSFGAESILPYIYILAKYARALLRVVINLKFNVTNKILKYMQSQTKNATEKKCDKKCTKKT